MEQTFEFLKQLLGQFFGGFLSIFTGIFQGIFQMFNFPEYVKIFQEREEAFTVGNWIIAIIFILLILAFIVGVVFLIVHFIKKLIKKRKPIYDQQELLKEIDNLNAQVLKSTAEKDKIMAMKVSQLGLKPGTLDGSDVEAEEEPNKNGESRFYKLCDIDALYIEPNPRVYNKEINLKDFCDAFRMFSANKLKLYYDIRIIRLLIAGMASARLIILQGISGTGKTSLAYAFGKFLEKDALIASVQPSWRDRTEIFGYFNEFTKKYNETEILKNMYEARYTDDIYITVLDEMNISRVEYYFAEMLSILEMPTQDEWVVDIVPSGWASDPKFIEKGRFRLPVNMWYIGTANNDDSTFAISDKVYDRALPINIDTKGVAFETTEQGPINMSSEHLSKLFNEAINNEEYIVEQDLLDKIEDLDNFVIEHFRLAFGNRIVKQLKLFVPAYVACGGTKIDGIDYILCNKILRKFESLNLGYIRDEIDGLIEKLSDLFGEDNMQDSKAYLRRLQKME